MCIDDGCRNRSNGFITTLVAETIANAYVSTMVAKTVANGFVTVLVAGTIANGLGLWLSVTVGYIVIGDGSSFLQISDGWNLNDLGSWSHRKWVGVMVIGDG